MTINPIRGQQAANVQAEQPQAGGRYSRQAPQLARKICLVAGAAFALHVVSNIPVAEAGFALFAACMSICTAATAGAFAPACFAACCAGVVAPTP